MPLRLRSAVLAQPAVHPELHFVRRLIPFVPVEPEAEEAPEEPEESPEEGNPFLDSATRAIKLSALKFGRNYHGEE